MPGQATIESRDGGVLLRFPGSFMWGSGVSAHQVEGGNDNNDWWDFEQRGNIEHAQLSGRATDFWNRYPDDLRLAAELGHNAMKISIEWARVEPEPGVIDEDALAHYRDILSAMRKRGIAPFVVAHHFTSPRWLGRYKWWLGKQTPGLFARYVGILAENIGDLVDVWCPVNEPVLLASLGYGTGTWPPGKRGWINGLTAYSRLADAHNRGYSAIREVVPHATIGACVNAVAVTPHEGSKTDPLLEHPARYLANFRYLDLVRDSVDFIGLQYYSRICPWRVFDGTGRLEDGDVGEGMSDVEWPIYSQGLARVVTDASQRYNVPIMITENGIADADDSRRERFIRDHLAWLHRAMRDGADVRGYLHWATTDNFEWLHGFGPRFGLIAVDYQTLRRTVRESALAYGEICRSSELLVPSDHPSLAE